MLSGHFAFQVALPTAIIWCIVNCAIFIVKIVWTVLYAHMFVKGYTSNYKKIIFCIIHDTNILISYIDLSCLSINFCLRPEEQVCRQSIRLVKTFIFFHSPIRVFSWSQKRKENSVLIYYTTTQSLYFSHEQRFFFNEKSLSGNKFSDKLNFV